MVPACVLAGSFTVPDDAGTIAKALSKAQKGDTVWVDDGVYREQVLLNPGVVLKSRKLFGAVIDGKGRGVVVTLANGCSVEGFEICNGTVGVVSKSADCRIRMCRIISNNESGVMCVGHLPDISDNVIAFNKGSGIQGWDVRTTSSTISHNTVAHNENHGLSFGGNSDVMIENCIVAFNGQYGLKAEDEKTRTSTQSNNFYRNGAGDRPMGGDNVSVDPGFVNAFKFDFALNAGSKCIKAGSDRQDLGARLLSE